MKLLSRVWLFAIPWTVACQVPPSTGFSRQECWSGLPFPFPKSESCSVLSNSLWPHGLDSPWNSPGQNTGVGRLSLLQGIFPTQGLNPGLPHCRRILYQLSRQGSPRILEWVAYPFSSRSSQPRNWTGMSCIAGGFFTNWAMREAPQNPGPTLINPTLIVSGSLGVGSRHK